MRYIAEKKEDKFLVTGLKEMETSKGEKVEVKIDTKEYDKEKLEEVLKSYTFEKEQMIEQYDNGIKDLTDMLEAINIAE